MPDDQYYGLTIDVGSIIDLHRRLKSYLASDGAADLTLAVVQWAADHDLLTERVTVETRLDIPPRCTSIDDFVAATGCGSDYQQAGRVRCPDTGSAPDAPVSAPVEDAGADEETDRAAPEDPEPEPEPDEQQSVAPPPQDGATVDAGACAAEAPAPRAGAEIGSTAPAPWTDADVATMWKMRTAGAPIADIARKLGRTYGAVTQKMRTTNNKMPGGERGGLQQHSPVEKAPVQAAETPAPAPTSAAEAPAWFRKIAAHLNAVGNKAPWSPKNDLALAEAVDRGDDWSLIADALGIERGDVRKRWVQLTPDGQNKGQITDLIAVLKSRIGGAA